MSVFALLVALSQQTTLAAPSVAPVPDSTATVAFEATGFRVDVARLTTLRRELGLKAVTIGSIDPAGARLSIIAEPAERGGLSSDWRAKLAGSDGQPFDVDRVACLEGSTTQDGVSTEHFHAFLVAARFCFDVHVAFTPPSSTAPKFGRDEFAHIVRSVRFAFLRRGGELRAYPSEVLELMDETARRMPDWFEWMSAERKSHPNDWARDFVCGEALRYSKSPALQTLEPYTAALELLAKSKELSPGAQLCEILAEDGLGLGLCDNAQSRESIAHFRRGYDLAKARGNDLCGSLAYNLSCSYAEVKEEGDALTWLKEAIAAAPRYRELAKTDSSFENLRSSTAFRQLLEPKDR